MVALRSTVTVQAARARTTVDASLTEVSLAATRSQFLKATLVSYGTPQSYLESFQRQFMDRELYSLFLTPTPASAPTISNNIIPPVQVTQPPSSAARSASNAATLAALNRATPSPTPTIASNQPYVTDVVTAQGVGDDDCAVGISSEFTNTAPAVYVVARAYNVTSGTRFASRWLLRNEEVVYHDFTSEFEFNDECIWFFIDEADTTLFVGAWSVVLEVNGVVQGAPTQFQVVAN